MLDNNTVVKTDWNNIPKRITKTYFLENSLRSETSDTKFETY